MPRNQSKAIKGELFLERMTLVDKQSPMFRAKRDNQYFVRVMFSGEKSTVNVREFIFAEKWKADDTYNHMKVIFGIK